MAHQQTQRKCRTCGKPTLHTRDTYDVPHLMHFLITVLCIGAWLPVWILHTLSNSFGSRAKWRCNQCGRSN